MFLTNRLSKAVFCSVVCCLALYASPAAAQPVPLQGNVCNVAVGSDNSITGQARPPDTTANSMLVTGNNLICDGSYWQYPAIITGSTSAGGSAISCATATAGAIEWTGSALQYCNGTSWTTLGGSGGSITGSGTTNYVARWTGTSALGTGVLYDNGTNVGIGSTSPGTLLTVAGPVALQEPSTVNASTYTVAAADSSLIFTTTASTITLPTASSFPGRILHLKAGTTPVAVTSNASNVVPQTTAAAGTAILPATAGAYATLQSDGTNWIIMESGTSGGGGSTVFSSITTGTNTAATMTVGAGGTLTYTSTGVVNASKLGGATFAAPGSIGSTTAGTGAFTTLTASSTLAVTGTSTHLGNVGIGTTTAPAVPLYVAGNTAAFGSGDGATPASSTLRGANAGIGNTTGGNLNVQAGNGTGSGGSGTINFVVGVAGTTPPAVAFDTGTTTTASSVSSKTISFTVTSNSNRLLIVDVSYYAFGSPVSSVTYAGTALTQLRSSVVGFNTYHNIYYLVAPATGANSLVVNFSSSFSVAAAIGVSSFYNVDQTTPIGAVSSNNGTNTSDALSVASYSGATVYESIGSASSCPTYGSGETADYTCTSTPSSGDIASSRKAGASTVTMTETFASQNFDHAAFEINIVGGGVGGDALATAMTVANTGYVGIGTATPSTALHVYGAPSSGTPLLTLTNTANNVYQGGLDFYTPNMTAGNNAVVHLGQAASTNNAMGLNFNYAGSGSASNRLDFIPYGQAAAVSILSGGSVGIGTTSPAAALDVAGNVKLGTAGVAMTAMGVCTVASYTPTTTAANKTCTGVPASTAVAVHCSPSAAFTTPNTTVINARATGTVNQIAVNLSVANAVAVSLTCMWVQP